MISTSKTGGAAKKLQVRLLLCAACGGPLPSPTAPDAGHCRYCKAPAAGGISQSVFSHDVCVLLCDHCSAPLPVPLGGGLVPCDHCSATSQVLPRREQNLGQTAHSGDEAARLAHLRAQDRGAVIPPSELHVLMQGGGLIAATAQQALDLWKGTREELRMARRAGPADLIARVEKRFYFLAELLADFHATQQDPLCARAILESSLKELQDPAYIQIIYCWIARQAAALGDRAAAEAWLQLADPTPDDLQMDSAVRFARAVIAMRAEDFAGVLQVLKRRRADLPLSNKYDRIADIYRAHAIEKLEGVDAALTFLNRVLTTDATWSFALDIAKSNPQLRLCEHSLPRAARRKFSWHRPALWTLVTTLTVFALGYLALAPWLLGYPLVEGEAVGSLSAAAGILLGLPTYLALRRQRVIRRRLKELEAISKAG